MKLDLLYFAAVRERLGKDGETVEVPDGCSVDALLSTLAERHEAIRLMRRYLRVAVNQEMAGPGHRLRSGDEVALIPPVAGGSDCLRIRETPLDPEEAVRAVSGDGVGGIVTFVGVVRRLSEGRRVKRLHYEAYREMAEAEFRRIAKEASTTWPDARVAILHRVGTLQLGDIAVVVAASAPHRAEAFLACRFAIDAVKERAPIWKKEIGEDGAVWVGLGS
jgi:MoaE-MoaD fusion protein